MPLTYHHFLMLNYEQQGHYLSAQGVYLLGRWHENYCINLYWLGSFFGEVWLEQECVERAQFRAFADYESLDAYLPVLPLLLPG